ncbi:MAG: porphobilinogen synthase [Candidatus Sumerlaeia bacterium]|nr:porphobilinogen synthase [Candidatus Sumerlaeia bacterium]
MTEPLDYLPLPIRRPRRNRVSRAVRNLVQEHRLHPHDLVLPVFLQEGDKLRTPISSLPGTERLSADLLLRLAEQALELGVQAICLFPYIPREKKTIRGEESLNPNGLLQTTLRLLKRELPELCLITDVALDPYSSDGHDGLFEKGAILNDATLPLLAAMAVSQAEAGADVVAPSDMMDGRVEAIRSALDDAGFTNTLICSYTAKYASAFYGPFRDALDSAPGEGDKKTYQMNPANAREADLEVDLDESEGADWLLVKPGLPYLDILARVRQRSALPLAVYHVSGELAMLKAAAERGWLNYDACLMESLLAFKRAGADMIFTYAALEAARLLRR